VEVRSNEAETIQHGSPQFYRSCTLLVMVCLENGIKISSAVSLLSHLSCSLVNIASQTCFSSAHCTLFEHGVQNVEKKKKLKIDVQTTEVKAVESWRLVGPSEESDPAGVVCINKAEGYIQGLSNTAARLAGWRRVTRKGVILYVMDGTYPLPFLYRTGCLTGAVQL
jgi:hypothetical protein